MNAGHKSRVFDSIDLGWARSGRRQEARVDGSDSGICQKRLDTDCRLAWSNCQVWKKTVRQKENNREQRS